MSINELVKFKAEVNITTLATLTGLLAMAIGWGITYQQVLNKIENNADRIAALQPGLQQLTSVGHNVVALQTRLSTLEKTSEISDESMRLVTSTLSDLRSDVRLLGEVLTRVERELRAQRTPNLP